MGCFRRRCCAASANHKWGRQVLGLCTTKLCFGSGPPERSQGFTWTSTRSTCCFRSMAQRGFGSTPSHSRSLCTRAPSTTLARHSHRWTISHPILTSTSPLLVGRRCTRMVMLTRERCQQVSTVCEGDTAGSCGVSRRRGLHSIVLVPRCSVRHRLSVGVCTLVFGVRSTSCSSVDRVGRVAQLGAVPRE